MSIQKIDLCKLLTLNDCRNYVCKYLNKEDLHKLIETCKCAQSQIDNYYFATILFGEEGFGGFNHFKAKLNFRRIQKLQLNYSSRILFWPSELKMLIVPFPPNHNIKKFGLLTLPQTLQCCILNILVDFKSFQHLTNLTKLTLNQPYPKKYNSGTRMFDFRLSPKTSTSQLEVSRFDQNTQICNVVGQQKNNNFFDLSTVLPKSLRRLHFTTTRRVYKMNLSFVNLRALQKLFLDAFEGILNANVLPPQLQVLSVLQFRPSPEEKDQILPTTLRKLLLTHHRFQQETTGTKYVVPESVQIIQCATSDCDFESPQNITHLQLYKFSAQFFSGAHFFTNLICMSLQFMGECFEFPNFCHLPSLLKLSFFNFILSCDIYSTELPPALEFLHWAPEQDFGYHIYLLASHKNLQCLAVNNSARVWISAGLPKFEVVLHDICDVFSLRQSLITFSQENLVRKSHIIICAQCSEDKSDAFLPPLNATVCKIPEIIRMKITPREIRNGILRTTHRVYVVEGTDYYVVPRSWLQHEKILNIWAYFMSTSRKRTGLDFWS